MDQGHLVTNIRFVHQRIHHRGGGGRSALLAATWL